jgi:CheY-like chemotaxis protein
MGQAKSPRPLVLVVEDDEDQRDLLTALFEESDMQVIGCESAEAALGVLDHCREEPTLLFTDVKLAGTMDGLALARRTKALFPDVTIIVTSGNMSPRQLPAGAMFMQKPWLALDILREAEKSLHPH